MGTRGSFGFRYKNKDKLAYNHFDSYHNLGRYSKLYQDGEYWPVALIAEIPVAIVASALAVLGFLGVLVFAIVKFSG